MQKVLFGKEMLLDYTNEIYQNGQGKLSQIEGTTISIDDSVKYAPKVTIERLGNTIELELYSNKYTLNGEEKELKTVMPYIKGKFYVPQEIIDIVASLEENINSTGGNK